MSDCPEIRERDALLCQLLQTRIIGGIVKVLFPTRLAGSIVNRKLPVEDTDRILQPNLDEPVKGQTLDVGRRRKRHSSGTSFFDLLWRGLRRCNSLGRRQGGGRNEQDGTELHYGKRSRNNLFAQIYVFNCSSKEMMQKIKGSTLYVSMAISSRGTNSKRIHNDG